jgi:protein TonB
MEDAAPTREAAKETHEKVEEEMPKVERSPAPDPEVVLPMLKPVFEQKPEEEKPEEKKTEEKAPKLESVEQTTAAAPPRVEARETPVAPSAGSTAAAARARATWEKALISHLNRFKRYPDAARSRGNQGDVAVAFTIDRMGSLVASRIVRSSGSSALDEEALATLQRASPLPAPPSPIAGATFDLTLPVQFRIR